MRVAHSAFRARLTISKKQIARQICVARFARASSTLQGPAPAAEKYSQTKQYSAGAMPEGCGLPLRGPLAGYWKHPFGNHRVVYRIYPKHRMVVVCSAGIRKQGDAEDIYRQLESAAKAGRLAEQLASVLKNLLSAK